MSEQNEVWKAAMQYGDEHAGEREQPSIVLRGKDQFGEPRREVIEVPSRPCDGTVCRGEGEICGVQYQGYFCTLPLGHAGNHSACGNIEHNLRVWPQANSLKQ